MFFDVEGIFHAVWDSENFWCEVCMSCLLIIFDAHCECMKVLLSDYYWGAESCDKFLGMERIYSSWLRVWWIFENDLFGQRLNVCLDLEFFENYRY